jgi:CBS-domain-containing membrane protein
VQARDVMTSPVVSVTPATEVADTARLLLDRRISAVPVVDEAGKLVGIVSEGDLMRRRESGTERRLSWWLYLFSDAEAQTRAFVKAHSRRVSDVMSRRVVTVAEDAPLEHVADILEKYRIKRVPVMRGDALVGIISRADLLHGLIARQDAATVSTDDRTIKQEVLRALAEAQVNQRFLNVVVSGGVVRIWGVVDSTEQKEAVRVAAESVPGVKAVHLNVDAVPDSAVMWPD